MSEISDAQRDAMVDAGNDLLASGTVQIRTGTPPGVDQTATGTLLATFTLDATPFNASSGGTATAADLPLSTTPVANGTAGYYRAIDSGASAVREGSCGTSGADMILSTTSLTTSNDVEITAWSTSQPAGSPT